MPSGSVKHPHGLLQKAKLDAQRYSILRHPRGWVIWFEADSFHWRPIGFRRQRSSAVEFACQHCAHLAESQ